MCKMQDSVQSQMNWFQFQHTFILHFFFIFSSLVLCLHLHTPNIQCLPLFSVRFFISFGSRFHCEPVIFDVLVFRFSFSFISFCSLLVSAPAIRKWNITQLCYSSSYYMFRLQKKNRIVFPLNFISANRL